MKRPLFWAGMVCLCASAILCLLGEEWLFAALSLSFLLGMLALVLHRASPHLFAAAAGVLLACAGHWAYLQHSICPMQALTGQTRQFSGYVVSVANWDNRTEYLLAGRVEEAGSRIVTLRLVTFQEEQEWQICQPLAGEVKLVETKEQYRTRQRVQGIHSDIRLGEGGLTAPKVQPSKGWGYYTALLRLRLGEQLARFIPRNAPLVSQMLFSQEATISSETFDQMAKAGVAHVLVVSGQHLAIALQGVLLLAGVLRLKKWMTALLGGCTVLLVGLMAGFAPSISRAAVMSLMMLGATLFDRENDPLTALGVSAALLCLINPYAAISRGMVLSYGATLSILLFYQPVYGWLREAAQSPHPRMDRLLRWVQGAVALWASSQILIIPVAALLFGYLPTYGLLFNLILTPVVPVLLVGAWAVGALGVSGLQAFPALLGLAWMHWAALPWPSPAGVRGFPLRQFPSEVGL